MKRGSWMDIREPSPLDEASRRRTTPFKKIIPWRMRRMRKWLEGRGWRQAGEPGPANCIWIRDQKDASGKVTRFTLSDNPEETTWEEQMSFMFCRYAENALLAAKGGRVPEAMSYAYHAGMWGAIATLFWRDHLRKTAAGRAPKSKAREPSVPDSAYIAAHLLAKETCGRLRVRRKDIINNLPPGSAASWTTHYRRIKELGLLA